MQAKYFNASPHKKKKKIGAKIRKEKSKKQGLLATLRSSLFLTFFFRCVKLLFYFYHLFNISIMYYIPFRSYLSFIKSCEICNIIYCIVRVSDTAFYVDFSPSVRFEDLFQVALLT